MSTVSPSMRTLAMRLQSPVTAALDERPGSDCHAVLRACEPLRGPLTRLTGRAGYESLLRRAIALSSSEFPSLKDVVVGTEGLGISSGLSGGRLDAAVASAGASADELGVIILARLLGLLEGLIGEPLMLRLVREGWPRVSLDGWNTNEGST